MLVDFWYFAINNFFLIVIPIECLVLLNSSLFVCLHFGLLECLLSVLLCLYFSLPPFSYSYKHAFLSWHILSSILTTKLLLFNSKSSTLRVAVLAYSIDSLTPSHAITLCQLKHHVQAYEVNCV